MEFRFFRRTRRDLPIRRIVVGNGVTGRYNNTNKKEKGKNTSCVCVQYIRMLMQKAGSLLFSSAFHAMRDLNVCAHPRSGEKLGTLWDDSFAIIRKRHLSVSRFLRREKDRRARARPTNIYEHSAQEKRKTFS